MEKSKCKKINANKTKSNHHGSSIQHPPSSSSSTIQSPEKKRKKWKLSNLLKRTPKNQAACTLQNDGIPSITYSSKNFISKNIHTHNHIPQSMPHSLIENHFQPIATTNENHKNSIHDYNVGQPRLRDSSNNFYNSVAYSSRNSESSSETFKGGGGNSNRRNLVKARIKAKRERYHENSSSSNDEHYSNSSVAIIQSGDNFHNVCRSDNNRRTRGARTERYMKRLYRDDSNDRNDDHEPTENDIFSTDYLPLIRSKKKNSSDILSPHSWTNDNVQLYRLRKMPLPCRQSFNHEQYRNTTYSNSNQKAAPPPTPPPRSSKLRGYITPLNYSIKNFNIENEYVDASTIQYRNSSNHNGNCHSLDRKNLASKKNSNQFHYSNDISTRHSYNGESSFPLYNNSHTHEQIQENILFNDDRDYIETPIVPQIHETRKIQFSTPTVNPDSKISNVDENEERNERKRHSKNLEEALEELEVIYNSLHLNNDEGLLDRAEQRSMDEYRDKIAKSAINESIKSLSDTSSSQELLWRHSTISDQCHLNDPRMKDDMAYRRIHQNERPSSVDSNQMSLSRYSYLANSPILSRNADTYCKDTVDMSKSRSRRSTPDLLRDDVVYRTINHANNSLKIVEPQPPFGIPLGPVTTAVESDYLHVEPTRNSSRSSYIPQSEPDIVTDDLAFRNLRKDSTKNQSTCLQNANFFSPIDQHSEMKKKRAVRSFSADLYGMIKKGSNNQYAWYKEYVKLNCPRRLSDCDEDLSDNEVNTDLWRRNREYYDLDINGNRPKSTYQGRVQVCIPQDDEKLTENKVADASKSDNDKKDDECASSSLLPNIDVQISKVIDPNDNNELTEYKELCHNLESLINKILEKAKSVGTNTSDSVSKKNTPGTSVDWNEFFSKDDIQMVESKSSDIFNLSDKNESKKNQAPKGEKINQKLKCEKTINDSFDIDKELYNLTNNSLSSNMTENKQEIRDDGSGIVINENASKELNSSSNVPYECINRFKVMSNKMEIAKKKISSKYNEDSDESPISIDLNEQNDLKSDETKESMVLNVSSTSLTNLTNEDGFKKNDDLCIHDSSTNEGEEFEKECITSSTLCQTSHKHITNVCLFNTNCLSTYYVALCSVCLTLLIAIVIAR